MNDHWNYCEKLNEKSIKCKENPLHLASFSLKSDLQCIIWTWTRSNWAFCASCLFFCW